MKLFVNILLGLLAVLAVLALVFQGFLFPALAGWICVLLRLAAAFFAQLLFRRLFSRLILQAIPIMAAGVLALCGFFLYLTVPSWLGVTFGSFFADFAAPLLACALVWLLHFLRPQLRMLRKQIRRRLKKKK